jgi:hypothetical protein
MRRFSRHWGCARSGQNTGHSAPPTTRGRVASGTLRQRRHLCDPPGKQDSEDAEASPPQTPARLEGKDKGAVHGLRSCPTGTHSTRGKRPAPASRAASRSKSGQLDAVNHRASPVANNPRRSAAEEKQEAQAPADYHPSTNQIRFPLGSERRDLPICNR